MYRSYKDRTKGDKRTYPWAIKSQFKKIRNRMKRSRDKQTVRDGKIPEVNKKDHGWDYW